MRIKGPRRGYWPGICKTGKMQSPIALCERLARSAKMPDVKLENFQDFKNVKVENTGVTVRFSFPEVALDDRPKISGGGLTERYSLHNIHLHWPAEHLIDEKRYDLEAHLVFYNDQHGSFQDAAKRPYGLTVLALLFTQNSSSRNRDFHILAKAVQEVSDKPGQGTIVPELVNLGHFLPRNHRQFYYYRGSLTTPHCVEYVHWTVMKYPSDISCEDFKELTHIYNEKGELIDSNNRDLQPLNGRIICVQTTQ